MRNAARRYQRLLKEPMQPRVGAQGESHGLDFRVAGSGALLGPNDGPLAFRDHDEETQRQFLASAEFADEWFSFGAVRKADYLRSW